MEETIFTLKGRKSYIKERFFNAGIAIDDAQAEMFAKYYGMLAEKNKVMNLTAITDFKEVVQKHFIDSLMIGRVFIPKDGSRGIDVGTGAGFPGIPIKITYPEVRLTLADSLNKRLNFLNEVIMALGLKEVDTVHGRAEDLAHSVKMREKYDFCVSRAVAKLSVLTEYCLPFVKTGGVFVAYKSGNIDEEIKDAANAIKITGGQIQNVEEFLLPETDIKRSLVVIEKQRSTLAKYPRKAGTPAREPL